MIKDDIIYIHLKNYAYTYIHTLYIYILMCMFVYKFVNMPGTRGVQKMHKTPGTGVTEGCEPADIGAGY